MTIPPFPSQDLAKLVLGYLAEEQLMTAYDELLQTSPYLDALRNEYDRVLMTSLRNIVAEYRAVKIYVETCKPVILRRRLFGCANLLEAVKLLIQNVDVSKLQGQDHSVASAQVRNVPEDVSPRYMLKTISCEVCNSLKLNKCGCKSQVSHKVNSPVDLTSESSLETTALEDLPGHHAAVKRKQMKVLEKDSKMPFPLNNDEFMNVVSKEHSESSVLNIDQVATNTNLVSQMQTTPNACVSHSTQTQSFTLKSVDYDNSKEKIEEFNSVLNKVYKSNTIADMTSKNKLKRKSIIGCIENNRLSAGSFQDFASGVQGVESRSTNIADSSTTENFVLLPASVTKTMNVGTSNCRVLNATQKRVKTYKPPKTTYFVKVNNRTSLPEQENVVDLENLDDVTAVKHVAVLKPKTPQQKVTILSNIKVDKSIGSKDNGPCKMQQVLKNATSTPLTQMQTVHINGTPAFKHELNPLQSKIPLYTSDEIMSMPTLVLVPTSGSENNICQNVIHSADRQGEPHPILTICAPQSMPTISQSAIQSASDVSLTNKVIQTSNSSARNLGPLVIDVVTSNYTMNTNSTSVIQTMPSADVQENTSSSIMQSKTGDVKNATAPKDTTETLNNTPNTLPPPSRKASSTPRRTSHIRVLNFTTPRRILQEPVQEHPSEGITSSTENLISKSPSLHTFTKSMSSTTVDSTSTNTVPNDSNNIACTKENEDANKLPPTKTKNWDSDLRALAIGTPSATKSSRKPKTKSRSNKNNTESVDRDRGKSAKKSSKKKATNKHSKVKQTTEDEKNDVISAETTVNVPIKPTINIIPGPSWRDPQDGLEKLDKSQNKLNNEDQNETPEMDRVSLQNVIEAKLNISDFLETPYKQALYDIQMETPRFLGPDLPGEPLSDIKITSIPTPRFLVTPKASQPTPSSYSSRPTDYSSGGSYYKPDEQDYLRVEELGYPETSVEAVKPPSASETDGEQKGKSSRPVRKCTKNVSYYRSPAVVKTKDSEKSDVSPCSETYSINSTSDKVEQDTRKPIKENKHKSLSKTETKKIPLRKRKTPVKKDSFIKIKPRKSTPSSRKAAVVQSRKKTSSKEKHVNIAPLVTSVPTKSRRKSSTPRKLNCTKTFNSESSDHESPEMISKTKDVAPTVTVTCMQDSDTEQLPLRWSDDGSQDGKLQSDPQIVTPVNDSDDITKIQEYIANSSRPETADSGSSLHEDLVKRGFDIETAKIIERDLLDSSPFAKENQDKNVEIKRNERQEVTVEAPSQSDASASSVLNIDKDNNENGDEEEEEEIEFTVHDCNEESGNYVSCVHDKHRIASNEELQKLKDKFSMEVCIDDGVTIRLRATPFTLLLDQDPRDPETELAVDSISNIEKLYTPMKESVRAQCFEIFDSTLTSLDTPLRPSSPKNKEHEVTVTEILLEVEKEEPSDNFETKKRKRLQSENGSDDSTNDSKKVRPGPQYLLNSTNIQNIDIETVLSKLHGP